MNRLASPAQLRASFLRWALFLVPGVLLLGYLSAQVSGSGADNPWFRSLTLPAAYPGGAVFPWVWSALYAMMGIAAAFVCSAWGARGRAIAVLAFVLQLVANLAWSPVFFGEHEIRLALYVIFAIDALALLTAVLFWRVRRLAGLLLLPYLAWLGFATWLNWQVLELNPLADGAEVSGAVQRIEL